MSKDLPYSRDSKGKCPHCQCTVFFADAFEVRYDTRHGISSHPLYLMTASAGDTVKVFSSCCPNCEKPIVTAQIESGETISERLVHPFNIVRTVPSDVPKEIQNDFLEAASVLSTSEKASAALSRRCLQNLLNDKGCKGKNLSEQIDAALKDLLPE